MKKTLITAIIILAWFGSFSFTQAAEEYIKSFNANITVNTDGSISVIEEIIYNSGGASKHGIYRDIRTVSSQGKRMPVKDIEVVLSDESSVPWSKELSGDNVRLKIGDPDTTFSGEKSYKISYRAIAAVSQYEGFDEIYWNATGNAWQFPIQEASAIVRLPEGATVLQQACYTGQVGETTPCDTLGNIFTAKDLSPGEGLTVAVGFPKEFVAFKKISPLQRIVQTFWPILIPILVFIICYRRWDKRGRDPKDSAVIIPQYDVPDGLTPLDVGSIVRTKNTAEDISAQLIYLAEQGFIHIKRIEHKALGMIINKDYIFTLQKPISTAASLTDKKILDGIFTTDTIGATMKLSALNLKFYAVVPSIVKSVRGNLLSRGYYTNLPDKTASHFEIPAMIIAFFIALFMLQLGNVFYIFLISALLAGITFVIFNRLMPARSVKGVQTREYLLGLKEYLQIAEKDRIKFHNAPEKKPELFEKLLPFAMVLGVEKEWAKEFEGIYLTPPTWYEGNTGVFSAAIFANELRAFETSAVSMAIAPIRSSGGGSGGGGSSGGGGGGGGGGSW
jgi:uncharacterized membrane protein YgcG